MNNEGLRLYDTTRRLSCSWRFKVCNLAKLDDVPVSVLQISNSSAYSDRKPAQELHEKKEPRLKLDPGSLLPGSSFFELNRSSTPPSSDAHPDKPLLS